jgi:hypothetical protein
MAEKAGKGHYVALFHLKQWNSYPRQEPKGLDVTPLGTIKSKDYYYGSKRKGNKLELGKERHIYFTALSQLRCSAVLGFHRCDKGDTRVRKPDCLTKC